MNQILEHPEIGNALRTGYPSWMQESEGHEENRDAYEAYCDALYEQSREEKYGW